MDINELLRYANESGASDLFIGANKIPAFRINGQVLPGEGDITTQEEIDAIPEDVMKIIRKMTVLRPLSDTEKQASEEKNTDADKK